MTGKVNTPEQLLALANDIVMHGACAQTPLSVYVEVLFTDENGASRVMGKMSGPTHAIVGQATDPASLVDIEKLQEMVYPEQAEELPPAQADEDEEAA